MNKFPLETLQTLNAYLNQECNLPNEEIELVLKSLQKRTFQKGEFILNQGQIETKLYYILTGSVHQYHLVDSLEVTTNIAIAGMSFQSDISYTSESPSIQIQKAISDVNLVYLEKKQVEQLINKCPKFCYVVYKKLEQVHLKREVRALILQQKSALKRYTMFLDNEPRAQQYMDEVAQKYIASYIGLSQEAFSRAKKEYNC